MVRVKLLMGKSVVEERLVTRREADNVGKALVGIYESLGSVRYVVQELGKKPKKRSALPPHHFEVVE
jgi:Ni,Fe-hydrogenase III large subunit